GTNCRLYTMGACSKPVTLIALQEVKCTRHAYGPVMVLSCWAHIPSHLVVTRQFSHHMLDLSMRYPHDVSSPPTAICMEMRHGTDRQSDPRKPHHHRRFPQRSDLRPAP